MKFILLLLSAVLITNVYSQDKKPMDEVQNIIKETKLKYAPDDRTAIFTIKAIKQDKSVYLEGKTNIPEAKAELLSKIAELKIKCDDWIVSLPTKDLGEEVYGVINQSVANLKTASSHASEMATQSLLGFPVKVLEKTHDDWYRIQTPEKYIAWVEGDGVARKSKKELDDYFSAKKIIYTNYAGFSYQSPDNKSQVVSDIVKGDVLKFVQTKDNFTEVEYPDGRHAFLENDNIKDLNDWYNGITVNTNDIIETAKKFVGIPYFWGGTSVKAMDCSGFTKTVYYLNGILLNRDASQQVNQGELVDTKDGFTKLLKGDLLFFGTKGTDSTKERVTHVGMYIGNYEYIHCSGRVRFNSFDNSKENFNAFRFNSFIKAKRIVGVINKNVNELINSNNFYSK